MALAQRADLLGAVRQVALARHEEPLEPSAGAQVHAVVQGVEDDVDLRPLELLDEPQRTPTPGQFVVLYDGERCLGGATIDARAEASPALRRRLTAR